MKEQLTPHMQQHVQLLHRYMNALERGDAETIAVMLGEAEQDQALERMILEVNEVYQHEDHVVIQATDIAAAQQFLLKAIPADQTRRREEMHMKKVATPVFPARTLASRKWYRSRVSWIAAVVAAALIVLLLLPGTSVLANQFLSLFRVQHFQPVTVTHQDISTLSSYSAPSIDDFGSVSFQANSFQTHYNLTQAQAAHKVNFPIQLPGRLPQGVSGDPTFGVMDSGHGTFTFSAAKMHAYLVKNGHGNVQIPANLNGATFDVTTTAGVMIRYGLRTGNPFVVVELPSPVLQATGSATLQQLRDFVLSLPGLPSQLVAQLKQIDLNSGTVPFLVPSGIDSQSVTVHGTSGLLLTNSKTTSVENIKQFPAGSMVVWQRGGVIYALGGVSVDKNQLLTAADSIK